MFCQIFIPSLASSNRAEAASPEQVLAHLLVHALLPADGTLDGALPPLPTLLALGLGHRGREVERAGGVDLCERLGLADVPAVQADRRAREERGAKRGRPVRARDCVSTL